jgi:hypothetical protein
MRDIDINFKHERIDAAKRAKVQLRLPLIHGITKRGGRPDDQPTPPPVVERAASACNSFTKSYYYQTKCG